MVITVNGQKVGELVPPKHVTITLQIFGKLTRKFNSLTVSLQIPYNMVPLKLNSAFT